MNKSFMTAWAELVTQLLAQKIFLDLFSERDFFVFCKDKLPCMIQERAATLSVTRFEKKIYENENKKFL